LIRGATDLHRWYGQSRLDSPDQRAGSGNTTIYAPIGLMIVVSIVGTILLNLLFRR